MFLEVAPDLIILSHGDRCVHMAWTAHAETRSPKRNGVERSGTADGEVLKVISNVGDCGKRKTNPGWPGMIVGAKKMIPLTL